MTMSARHADGLTSGHLDLGGEPFHYLAAGPDDGPVALCLHGFPDTPHGYAPILRILGDAGYRAIAPWMRGYAPSTLRGPYDLDRIGQDVVDLADALSPDAPIAVVGHDWGAAATHTALMARPDRFRSAVTMAVPPPLTFLRALRRPSQLRKSWYMMLFQLPRLPEAILERGDFALIRHLWRRWSPDYHLPAVEQHRLEQCLRASMPAPIGYYRAMFRPPGRTLARLREVKRQAGIEVPTRHIHGANDGCIGVAALAGQERRFRTAFDCAILGGAGHFVHIEKPDEVAGLVLDWITRRRWR